MNKPSISIIVAVYNVDRYLSKCIESILAQTYADFKLLLVDDGSTDRSLEICNRYAGLDGRIRVMSKQNGGQASARNLALGCAGGDYVGFVDSDDWIDATMYARLLAKAMEAKADIVQCGWWKVEAGGGRHCPYPGTFEEVYTCKEALAELTVGTGKHINTSVCCKLFRREVVSGVRFREVRAYEDDEFVYKTVSESDKIVCMGDPLYFYLNRENSTMTNAFNANKLALLPIQDGIAQILKTRLPEYYGIARKNLCSKQFYVLYQLDAHPEVRNAAEHFDRVRGEVLANYDEYMNNPAMGANRYMLLMMRYLPRFVWMNVLRLKFRNR